MSILRKTGCFFLDLVRTLILWTYFTAGFLIFYLPFYLTAFLFSKNRENAFQRLNHRFYKNFFVLARILISRMKMEIPDSVRAIRSSVIVCNHLSYIDPILLISLYKKHKTIVKSAFFHVPVFGWFVKNSGYLPSTSGNDFSTMMIERIEGMKVYLASGGNLFVFPEGTRSRDGKIGPFNKSAFKIAKRCRAPITVLRIRNTQILFRPGRFLWNTCVDITVGVECIATLTPDYEKDTFSVSGLMEQVRRLY